MNDAALGLFGLVIVVLFALFFYIISGNPNGT